MRRHAGLNPQAKYRDPITVEDVLASRIISSPLHLLDCCIISDGGGALVLTSRRAGARPARSRRSSSWAAPRRCGTTASAARPARHRGAAVGAAGARSAPASRTPTSTCCMIYDSYTITVLATLEALGFCQPGEGGAFCAGGRIGLGGALPVNTDGGGLSSNHPGHARHLPRHRGRRGSSAASAARRRCRTRELALVHGTGGMLGQRHSGVTHDPGRR